MDTKLLDYFIACYELGSINKAAHALYISPQGMKPWINWKLRSRTPCL